MQDDIGGLQVLDEKRSSWIAVPPIRGAYVVNLGDMTQFLTNMRYHSNYHRVINQSSKHRYSVPFFYNGNPKYIVKFVPTCIDASCTEPVPEVTVEEHILKRYKETYGRAGLIVN